MAGKKPIPGHDIEMGGAAGGGVRGSTIRPAPKGGSVGKRSGVKFGKAKKTTAKKLFTDKDVRRTAEKRGMGRFVREGGGVEKRIERSKHLQQRGMEAKNMSARQRESYVSKHGLGDQKGWRDWASQGKGASKGKQRYQADQKAKRVNYVRKEMVEAAKKHGGVTKKGKSKSLGFDKHMDKKAADSGKAGQLRWAKGAGRKAAALKTLLKPLNEAAKKLPKPKPAKGGRSKRKGLNVNVDYSPLHDIFDKMSKGAKASTKEIRRSPKAIAADAKAKNVLRKIAAANKRWEKVSTTPGKAGIVKPKRRAGKPGKVKGKVKSKVPGGYQSPARTVSGKKPLSPYARGGSNRHKIKNRGPDPEDYPGYE